jgi:hypothetical protein
MDVFTYYDPDPNTPGFSRHSALLRYWENAWRAVGFCPRILRYKPSLVDPRVSARLASFPSMNSRKYTAGNILRWLHLAEASPQGGLMVDFDVLPRRGGAGLPQLVLATVANRNVYVLDETVVPCAVWMNAHGFAAYWGWMWDDDLIRRATLRVHGRPHISDMAIFIEAHRTYNLPHGHMCMLYNSANVARAFMLHFATDACAGRDKIVCAQSAGC